MKTDRELLELAAKAAGIEIDWDGDKALVVQLFRGHLKNWFDWNPLEDDGDALRLAVKLNLQLIVIDYGSSARVASGKRWHGERPSKGDKCEATRRAIVRAAAEIGGAA